MRSILIVLGLFLAGALLLAIVLLVFLYRRLERLEVPEGAGFFATLRLVPLGLVVALDLLDLSLDLLAAPLVWGILQRFRLTALRDVATVEALIPFTGPIPVLTLSWLATRFFGLGHELDTAVSKPPVIETVKGDDGRYVPR